MAVAVSSTATCSVHRRSTAAKFRQSSACRHMRVQQFTSRTGVCSSASAATQDTTTAAHCLSPAAAAAPGAAWQIYTGRMPLVGLEPVAAALTNTPLQQLLLLHTFVLVEGQDQVWYFDFLPLRPTSPATALLLLTASTAPGELRVKKLGVTAVKTSSTVKLIGRCKHTDALALARNFNKTYNTQLHLVHNNCSHHTNGLTQALLSAPPS